jgi:catechol 2,3-dioxygenase-like lactoylglutathione lyase family enzyme
MKISNAQVWVHDQEEALAFYTEKLGMEVRADVTLPEMGDFRWLTVSPPGQDDVSIVLMAIPGPPMMDEETTREVEGLMSKGFAGTVFLTTDDCRAEYERLKARGIEFTEAPEERPYGIDSGFRDPSGNSIRLTEVKLPATAWGRSRVLSRHAGKRPQLVSTDNVFSFGSVRVYSADKMAFSGHGLELPASLSTAAFNTRVAGLPSLSSPRSVPMGAA